ncbi:hypothetical protein FRC07_013222, partial [Ceratobasidium sp. 392]
MANLTMAQLAELPLSSPILLNLYTSFVVAITAALAIWGPTILSAIVERARDATGSSSDPDESNEEESKDDKDKEEDKEEDKSKKLWKRKNQIWAYAWEDVERPKKDTEDEDASMVFLAINRTWGRNSSIHDDHLWIEVNSAPLAELLRFEFKHVEGLIEDKPGIDA